MSYRAAYFFTINLLGIADGTLMYAHLLIQILHIAISVAKKIILSELLAVPSDEWVEAEILCKCFKAYFIIMKNRHFILCF